MDYEPGEKERVRDEMERHRRAENEERRQRELELMKGNRHQRRKLAKERKHDDTRERR